MVLGPHPKGEVVFRIRKGAASEKGALAKVKKKKVKKKVQDGNIKTTKVL